MLLKAFRINIRNIKSELEKLAEQKRLEKDLQQELEWLPIVEGNYKKMANLKQRVIHLKDIKKEKELELEKEQTRLKQIESKLDALYDNVNIIQN